MKETRCKNSGALLFHPSPEDLETISIKQENTDLKKRMDILERLVHNLTNKDA